MADRVQVTLEVQGMTCDGCARHVERALQGVPGVETTMVPTWRGGRATVEFEPGQLDLEKLIATVERMCLVKITRPPDR